MKKKILKVLAFITAAVLSVSALEGVDLGVTYAMEETKSETESSFDESAHGKVKDSGDCGVGNASSVKYKLYEDGMMYIYGTGTIGQIYDDYEKCRNIRKIVIEDGVTGIGEKAFYFCYNLISIEIPNSVKNIDDEAFLGCKQLFSIEIPGSVTYIGENVFGLCIDLENIKVEEGNTKYDSRDDCNAIIVICTIQTKEEGVSW